MKVGITQRIFLDSKGADRDSLEQDYTEYYQKFGLEVIPIPNVLYNVEDYVEKLNIERIILSGGGDINPKLYNSEPESGVEYQDKRDNTESELLKLAIRKDIPLLAECRGCQFLNIFFNGSLVLNIQDNIDNCVKHVASKHIIQIIDEKSANFLNLREVEVNSYHNNGFTKKELSLELEAFALSGGGIVEGVFHSKRALAGIMWHPERYKVPDEFNEKIVRAFLERKLFWK